MVVCARCAWRNFSCHVRASHFSCLTGIPEKLRTFETLRVLSSYVTRAGCCGPHAIDAVGCFRRCIAAICSTRDMRWLVRFMAHKNDPCLLHHLLSGSGNYCMQRPRSIFDLPTIICAYYGWRGVCMRSTAPAPTPLTCQPIYVYAHNARMACYDQMYGLRACGVCGILGQAGPGAGL